MGALCVTKSVQATPEPQKASDEARAREALAKARFQLKEHANKLEQLREEVISQACAGAAAPAAHKERVWCLMRLKRAIDHKIDLAVQAGHAADQAAQEGSGGALRSFRPALEEAEHSVDTLKHSRLSFEKVLANVSHFAADAHRSELSELIGDTEDSYSPQDMSQDLQALRLRQLQTSQELVSSDNSVSLDVPGVPEN